MPCWDVPWDDSSIQKPDAAMQMCPTLLLWFPWTNAGGSLSLAGNHCGKTANLGTGLPVQEGSRTRAPYGRLLQRDSTC